MEEKIIKNIDIACEEIKIASLEEIEEILNKIDKDIFMNKENTKQLVKSIKSNLNGLIEYYFCDNRGLNNFAKEVLFINKSFKKIYNNKILQATKDKEEYLNLHTSNELQHNSDIECKVNKILLPNN